MTEQIEVNGKTIELTWDDETDPQNSIGWVANDGKRITPVGPNMEVLYHAWLETSDGSDFERWSITESMQRLSIEEAKAEARAYFA